MALVERVAGCRHGDRLARGCALIVNLTVPPPQLKMALATI